jgi:hypothetical protein
MGRRRFQLVEHAVHPVADLEVVLEGLQVDVRSLVPDRLVEDVVQELDHRRGGRHRRLVLEVELGALLGQLRDQLLELGLGPAILLLVVAVDAGTDQHLVPEETAHLHAAREVQVIEHRRVERIGDRDFEDAPVDPDRQHREGPRRSSIDLLDRLRLRLHLGKVDEVQASLLRQGAGEVARVDGTDVDQDLADPTALLALDHQRFLQLTLVDGTVRLEDLTELSTRGHVRRPRPSWHSTPLHRTTAPVRPLAEYAPSDRARAANHRAAACPADDSSG